MWKSLAKAFTFGDTLFALAVLCLLLSLIVPATPRNPLAIEILKTRIMEAQSLAINTRQRVDVTIDNHYITINEQPFPLALSCQPSSFYFNHLGNVSQAHTIHCSSTHRSYRLAIELGGGVIEKK